jgi:hypothetical protein
MVPEAGWSYERPVAAYAQLAGHLAFYASKVDECWVDDERVAAQPCDGGWITANCADRSKVRQAPWLGSARILRNSNFSYELLRFCPFRPRLDISTLQKADISTFLRVMLEDLAEPNEKGDPR